MLALPMRGFMFLTRPLLRVLNHAANWCLRRVGVTPVDELADSQDPDALRQLVEHSATVGTLDERYHANLTSALELEALTVGQLAGRDAEYSSVGPMPRRRRSRKPPRRQGICGCWSATAGPLSASFTSVTACPRRDAHGT